ncbi:hypothetical protein KEM52_002232 [Ascosphaera acerosa]|nr:hypothetical protein KEM52_002232 [Ascosphaera acerosa]
MDFSPEQRQRYTSLIDQILTGSDLSSITAKQIRKQLGALVGESLDGYKSAVKGLILERFDAAVEAGEQSVQTGTPTSPASVAPSDGNDGGAAAPARAKRPASSDHDGESDDQHDAKRARDAAADVDADAMLAARMQLEENLAARRTRGTGVTTKKTKVQTQAHTRKKKTTTATVGVVDDDDEVKRTGGFNKPMMLSPALSQLLDGAQTLSRPQTVKRIWAYIKANDLQDPQDRRHIRCDERMRAVFKQDRVHMFTMNKLLANNLRDAEP